MRLSIIFLAASLCFSSAVSAVGQLQLDVSKNNFSSQQSSILNALNGSDDYSEITENDKVLVVKSLSEISELLSDPARFEQLNDTDRQFVFSNQQKINDALTRAAKDSRLICTKEHVLGSNLSKRVCRTFAAQKRSREQLQDNMAGKDTTIQRNLELK
jgi:hypothetical protein